MKMLSFLTTTYNRAHTLPKLYESLLQSEDLDFDWVVWDDGSEDGTRELIESWQKDWYPLSKWLFKLTLLLRKRLYKKLGIT